jgi:transcriptional regulator with PAS, ATPase and Fis domain
LFGYVDGAFTGATKGGKIGIFMQAHNGTIFFDEIGDMPINLQTKILRVIQEKEVMQIGDNKVIPIDVRIICATNKNLRESIKNNEFREDLYYRLAVLKVNVPPLRERGYDIVLLCEYYIDKYCNKYNKRKISLTDDAKQCLLNYSWRGNIRELRNICERIVALSFEESVNGEFLLKVLDIDEKETGHNEDIHKYINNLSQEDERLKQIDNLKEYERLKIINTLKKYNNNKTVAAKDLNISRVTLWRKIKEYNIL